jgi:hypothetical protein
MDYLKILNKIAIYEKIELIKGKTETLNYKNPKENENIKFCKDEIYCYKILSRLNGGKKEEIYYTDKAYYPTPDESKYKVLFPRGTASYNSVNNLKKINKSIVYSKIIDNYEILSTGIVYIECKTKWDAEVYQWYLMNSKFVRFMFIKENKFSELTKGFIRLLPKIDSVKIQKLNDIELYKYFNLTDDEVKFIESNV